MKSLVLAVCLLVAAPLSGATKNPKPPFKPITGAFFGVSVPNMAESVRWYSEKLGLAPVFTASGSPEVTVLEGGGLTVELIHQAAAQPGPTQPDLQHGVFKAGFLVRDFDSTMAELRARGVTIAFGPFPAQNGQRANVLIQDNAGNLIQIFSD